MQTIGEALRAVQIRTKMDGAEKRGFNDKVFSRFARFHRQKWKEWGHQFKVALRLASRQAFWLLEKAESPTQAVVLSDVKINEGFSGNDGHKWAADIHDSLSNILNGDEYPKWRRVRDRHKRSGHDRVGVVEGAVPKVQPVDTGVRFQCLDACHGAGPGQAPQGSAAQNERVVAFLDKSPEGSQGELSDEMQIPALLRMSPFDVRGLVLQNIIGASRYEGGA